MVRRRMSLSITLALAFAWPRVMLSQEASNKAFAPLTTDSAAWQRVVVYTVGLLSSQLVASATDPSVQPWRLEIPSGEPQEHLIRSQLRTILRVRQVMPADTLVR